MTTRDDLQIAGRALRLPPTERGRARWRRIVDVAARLFEERGYANVTISDIVAETGGSLATVYKWFGNKEELFMAVWGVLITEVCERISLLKHDGKTLEEDIENAIGLISSNVPFRFARVALLESGMFTRFSSEILATVEEKTNVPIANTFRRLREKYGTEFKLSDREMALVYVRYFRGLFLEVVFRPDDATERVESGKRILKEILLSLVMTCERG